MNKKLVAYFSASGVTAKLAKSLAEATEADLFEILPAVPYSDDDLNWMDKNSRSSLEMNDVNSRPEISGAVENMAQYDTVWIGFPIWWYVAPTIINTFLESYDFSGKKIVLFATSGGSGFGKTIEKLQPCVAPDTKIITGKVQTGGGFTKEELSQWMSDIGL